MFNSLSRQGMWPPTDQQTAVAWAEEMADGIKLWAMIDGVVVPAALFLWLFGLPAIAVGIVLLFAIGCPIMMILGYSICGLQYLSPTECYEIVKAKLFD